MQTSRDRFLDVVRAGAILAVIGQHWVMPVLSYSDGHLATGNALATPGWWVVTWLSQVMPLVFFAGGAANLISLRRAPSTRTWLAARHQAPDAARAAADGRLAGHAGLPARPGRSPQPLQVGSAIAAQLLWFLAVYVLVVLLTPLMVAAHRRWGLKVPLVMGVAGVLVDVARFNDLGYIGYANAIFVWVAVHQLGFHYVEGRLGTLTRRAALSLSAAGFGVTALMVAFGPYPASMIGMPGAPVSNMSPPTVLLAFLAVGQIGLLLAFRPQLNALAERPGVGTALSWLGARFMSVYLWHMPALIVVAGVTVYGLGYETPAPGTLLWLVMAPAWFAVCGMVLLGLLRLFAHFEMQRDTAGVTARVPQLVVAGLMISGGLLGLAAHGFAPLSDGFAHGPVPWVVLATAGFLLASKPVPVVDLLGRAVVVSERAVVKR